MPTKTSTKNNLYPTIKIDLIKNPIRFYAFPILGGLVKIIILIPVWIELIGVAIANFILLIVNSFVVLFTGKYLQAAYDLNLGALRLGLKITFFFTGLTNNYPGFSLSNSKDVVLDIDFPNHPNRWFAFPILGGVVRIILLIPYLIYSQVLKNGALVGQLVGSLSVLFKGQYPESVYEITRDQQRIILAMTCYMSGLSDQYPSFWMSMNHKAIKIILIIVGALIVLFNFSYRASNHPTNQNYYKSYNSNYNNSYQYPNY